MNSPHALRVKDKAPLIAPGCLLPQWGTVDAEIKVSSAENPELTNVLPIKRGLGRNISLHVLPTLRNFFVGLISMFPVHSSFFPFF